MRFFLLLSFLCQLILQTAAGQANFANPYTFITLAGGGTKDTNGHPIAGFQNGQGPTVQFRFPRSVVLDKKGNAYVGDADNHVIRKITPTGIASTLAGALPQQTNQYGNLIGGYLDGAATNALFNRPAGGCFDPAGNLYISDAINNVIRKITPDGIVTTIAGTGLAGYVNGVGTNALFNEPAGLTIDHDGNLYVVDCSNHCIRRITPDGNVSTIAGIGPQGNGGYADGIGTNALFGFPWDIVIDSTGNLFVTDTFNTCIRKITPVVSAGSTNWTVTTFAGNNLVFLGQHVDGMGTNAYFTFVHGIAIDAADNLFVTEANSDNIRRVTPAGEVTTLAGGTSGYADGTGNEARFYSVVGLAIDELGNLYVADAGNHVIRKGWNATAKPVLAFDPPVSTNGVMQLGFTVMTGTVTNLTLLETSQLGAAWTTNSTAVATTNVLGLSYTYNVPMTNSTRFYNVQAR
ncbi:MAG: repeat containing protein [Verrucomicrobiales bacterium]|nr:repeat containing protein [Verrucomicrobiales bacterium]